VADVFLSYARPNAAAARRIVEALEKCGWSVWYDPDLPAHRAYSDVIASELEAAKAVLVLWSGAAVDSQWVRSESNRGRDLGKLVQARLDDARLPMPFDQIQCADLTSWRRGRANSGWSQIVSSIDALLGTAANRAPAHPGSPKDGARRKLILGGAAATSVAAIGGGWWLADKRSRAPVLSPETAALMQQAKEALWQNTPEGQNQAIGMYRQVVAENPTYADAWGRLAMAYAWAAHWRQANVGEVLRDRARSAAQQALSLDRRDVHALFGLAFARPWMGNWLRIERELRDALEFSPKDSDVNLGLALILFAEGRIREPLQRMKVILAAGPTPGIYIFLTTMLWSAGRQEELDSTLDEATKLYPTHFGLWFTRFYAEMMGGRPEAALALAADTANRPTNIDPKEIDSVVRVAKAIQSRSQNEVLAVTNEWMERAHHGAGYAENAAQFMATLGRVDDAFAVLRAYYFSEGFDCGEVRFERATGSFTPRNDRQTAFLFNPALARLRADGRFAELVGRLRLTDNWRASHHLPDYLAQPA
jgi:tetratricopeptide (TPR) repeat protein